ncbi:MAG: GerMN domain-containing protein [Ilumatobacteraceae bacterium]
MRRARTALAVGAIVLVGACSTGDGELQQIDSADLFGLDETTTSTTTVTSAPPSSLAEPTVAATSTTVATEPVTLYFVDGSRLAAVSIDVARGPSPSRVVAALLAGPPAGDIGIGLRSRLPDNLVNTVVESGTGYVTVDIVGDAFQDIDPTDQRIAIGQLVLTLTQRPGIGQVRFTLDGQPMRVPRRDGLQTEPGDTVSAQDYAPLLDVAEPTTTVITVVPSAATEPPSVPTTS